MFMILSKLVDIQLWYLQEAYKQEALTDFIR